MNNKYDIDYFRSKGLLPFQAQFVVDFVESADKPYWELVMPVGLGKTHMTAALIADEVARETSRRILVISPAVLRMQWSSELSSMLPPSAVEHNLLVVNRKKYLELESHVSPGECPWPPQTIVLIGFDLAKRREIVDSLRLATWDLVVFDESHLLRGKRKEVFDELVSAGAIRRAILLTATPLRPLTNVYRRTIEYADVVDWDGQRLYVPSERKVIPIGYRRNDEEHSFMNEFQGFVDQLSNEWPETRLRAIQLVRAASSSTYAAEGVLRQLKRTMVDMRNKTAHGMPWTPEDNRDFQLRLDLLEDEPKPIDEVTKGTIPKTEILKRLYERLELLLDRVEDISTDSKFEALVVQLRKIFEANDKSIVCVLCSLVRTVEYLNSNLRQEEFRVHSLTGNITHTKRVSELDMVRVDGGVLIATDAILEGTDLSTVDECINYDLPSNPSILDQRWARFVRVRRKKSESKMFFMFDESKALEWEEKILSKSAVLGINMDEILGK